MLNKSKPLLTMTLHHDCGNETNKLDCAMLWIFILIRKQWWCSVIDVTKKQPNNSICFYVWLLYYRIIEIQYFFVCSSIIYDFATHWWLESLRNVFFFFGIEKHVFRHVSLVLVDSMNNWHISGPNKTKNRTLRNAIFTFYNSIY